MKRLVPVVTLALLLPLALRAQDDGARFQKDGADASAAATAPTPVSVNTADPSLDAAPHSTSLSALGQQPKARAQQKPKPSRPNDDERPPIEGSMVGYIDNAVIGSQVRVRFDAGFDDNRPDRAEFFYAQCGCDGGTARGPQPGLATHINFQQLYLRAEYAPFRRFSVFAELPFRWVQPQDFVPGTFGSATQGFSNQAGVSDLQAGFKFALVASPQRFLTFQLGAYFPSGDSQKALGTNHYSVEPMLLYFQRLTDRWSFEGQIAGLHAFEGATPGFQGSVFTYGLGPSYELYRGESVRFAPVVELVGWRVLGGQETSGDALLQQIAQAVANPSPIVSSEGTNIVNLKVGARTSIGNRNSFYVGFGQALTHELWYKHIVRFEYRFTF